MKIIIAFATFSILSGAVAADSTTNSAAFPVTITVDAAKSARRADAHLAFLRRGRGELRLHEGRQKIARPNSASLAGRRFIFAPIIC